MNMKILKMVVNSLNLTCFHGNDSNIGVIDGIFSGNDQQKVYYMLPAPH